MSTPNRWLHVRYSKGFSPELWALFHAHCRVFEAHARALLDNWSELGQGESPPDYEFFPPELSDDRTVASLPLGGESTLGSRCIIENACSPLLWQFMPLEVQLHLEEGLTEPHLTKEGKFTTNWRKPAQPE